MRDMAHSICLIKLYQSKIRKNFDFLFVTTLTDKVWVLPEYPHIEYKYYLKKVSMFLVSLKVILALKLKQRSASL